MALANLAPELLTQIFSSLHTISDVLNLAQTCRRLHGLLRSSQRLPTLFAAAEREFGPVSDILRLVTWNGNDSYSKRLNVHFKAVAQNAELLKQILKVGRVAKKIEDLYPSRKWGETRFLERRSLTDDEGWRLRRAVYRYWLYSEAFQNKLCTRGSRCLPQVVEERNKLLRDWTSDELFEIEDIRIMLWDIISTDLCPTYGDVERSYRENCDFSSARYQQQHSFLSNQQSLLQLRNVNWHSWPPDRYISQLYTHCPSSLPSTNKSTLPVPQRRKMEMRGWGDDIEQYYVVESMLKLNPAQIVHLYENATTKEGIEWYIESEIGGEWFWDNGQTWVDSWTAVIIRRGWDPDVVVAAIEDAEAGIVSDKSALTIDIGRDIVLDEKEDEQVDHIVCL